MGDDRRRRVAQAALDDDAHAIGGKDLDGRGQRRLRQGVGVHPGVERAVDAPPGAVVGDGLGDGGDVVVVEAAGRRCAAVARGAEADPLERVGRVGVGGVIGRDEARDVDESFAWGRLAGQWV